uniref:Uncharacterized protein n=1 Tax=Calidris pygmaea TaxID=425635 RepID=A0A8C3JKS4_9CHAR
MNRARSSALRRGPVPFLPVTVPSAPPLSPAEWHPAHPAPSKAATGGTGTAWQSALAGHNSQLATKRSNPLKPSSSSAAQP